MTNLIKTNHIGESSDFCSSDDKLSAPDFSKLDFDSYNELLQDLDQDPKTPKKTDMLGFPFVPILPYFMMTKKYNCPAPKVPVCCFNIESVDDLSPSECFYCE